MTSKQLTAVALFASLLAPVTSNAQGTRTVSDQWLVAAVRGGTGVGSGNLSRQDLPTPQARDQALERHYRMERSVRHMHSRLRHQFFESQNMAFDAYIYQSPDQAFCVLKKALSDAASQMMPGPMSRILLNRGVQLATAIEGGSEPVSCANPTNQATLIRKSRAAILFDWVKLVIDVSEDFDLQYYMPYNNFYGRCYPSPESCHDRDDQVPPSYRNFDYREFEKHLLKVAARQLKVINEGFTLHSAGRGVVPFGSYGIVLNVMQNLSVLVTLDLLNNMYGAAYYDATMQLHTLAYRIQYARDAYSILNHAHGQLHSVVNKLEEERYGQCDRSCAQENDWVAPEDDKTWVRPAPSKNVPGFFNRNDDGQWVRPSRK